MQQLISEKVKEMSAEQMITVERVKSLEINEGKTTEQIALIKSDVNDLKQQYMSHSSSCLVLMSSLRSHATVIAPCITTIAS
jgi:hypothetical protein